MHYINIVILSHFLKRYPMNKHYFPAWKPHTQINDVLCNSNEHSINTERSDARKEPHNVGGISQN